MHFLAVDRNCALNGGTAYPLAAGEALVRRGHQFTYAGWGGPLAPVWAKLGARWLRTPAWPLSALWVGRYARQQGVSCLLCSARGPGRYAALGTAERLGLPCLCFAHDPLKSDLATAELLRYTALVTFEAPVYEAMRERGLPEERLHLWPRPVRVADLQPAPTEVFRILHLGRLSRLKAQSALALIAATPDLAQAIPDLEIVIVGGGGKGRLVAQAAAAMNERCGRQVVRCTGPSLDPLGCIEQSNLVVAGGYSALEALYNGRPAILSGFGWLGPATAAGVPEAVNLHFADRSPARSNPELVTASVITVYNALQSETEGREYLPSRSWFPQDHTPDHGAQLLEHLAQQLTQAVPLTGGEGR